MTNYDEPTVIEKLLAEKKVKVKTFTKDEVVAMLEDLDLLIDEYDSGCGWDGYIKKIDAHALITRKINALKGDTK